MLEASSKLSTTRTIFGCANDDINSNSPYDVKKM
jgi:hypothetical protein